MEKQLQKLKTFSEDPQLAIFDELNKLNDNITDLIKATESSKTEVVSINNLSDAQTDLSPLERNFEALKASMDSVTDAIKAIQPAKAVNMEKVESLLAKLNAKEQKDIDLAEFDVITSTLEELIDEVKKSRDEEVA